MGLATKILSQSKVSQWGLHFLSNDQFLKYSSQIIILISLFLFTLLLGWIARWFFIKSFFNLGDKILQKIPIVNKVYKTSKDIINSLFITDKNSFKQVVLTPFPDEDSYAIGLVSKKSPCSEDSLSVFVPTTPNPTSGFLLIYKKKDLIFLDMKTEEAIKYIISCGAIIPKGKNS